MCMSYRDLLATVCFADEFACVRACVRVFVLPSSCWWMGVSAKRRRDPNHKIKNLELAHAWVNTKGGRGRNFFAFATEEKKSNDEGKVPTWRAR